MRTRTYFLFRRVLPGLAALAIIAGAAAAQAPANEAQVKAAFVFNFLKFIEWPSEAFAGPQDSLIIGIVGGGPTADATEAFLARKVVNGRPIGTRRLGADDTIGALHAVFVGDIDARHAQRVLSAVEMDAIVSIGEESGFASRGGIIGLVVEGQKVRFEINAERADSSRLRISSKLLALARVVHGRARERADP